MAGQPPSSQPRSMIIEGNPIGKGLDAFRDSFKSICGDANPDALEQLGQEGKIGDGAYVVAARTLLTIIQTSRTLYSPFYQRRETFPLPACCLPRPVVAHFEVISYGLSSHSSSRITSTLTVLNLF
jgi:hypothetical protein